MIARRHAFGWLAGVVTGLLTLTPAALAQDGAGISITRSDVAQYPDVTLEVSIPANLTNGAVNAADIEVFENGRPIPADVTRVPTGGLEVVLLIDSSASMRENGGLEAAKDAAAGFLAELPSDVPVGIVAFSDVPSLVSPLTSDRDLLLAALGGLVATGETALYDGIVFGSSLFSGGSSDRQFVLLSDGGDTIEV